MNLFYTITTLVLSAGFIAGYKAGFFKLFVGVLTTAVAVCTSCCCFILLYPQLNKWFNFSYYSNIAISISIIVLVTLLFLAVFLKFFKPCIYKARTKNLNSFLGAAAGVVLFTSILITVCTLTNVLKIPEAIAEELDSGGVTQFINSTAATISASLPESDKQNNKEIILAADNTDRDVNIEKKHNLPFLSNTFIVRPDLENEILQLANEERKAVGLPILTADSQLTYVARKHCADMFLRGYFSHNTPEGYTPFNRLQHAKINYLYAGENLAFAATITKAHKGLMLSAGHRANILNKNYRRAGFGVLESPLYGLLITQEFKD